MIVSQGEDSRGTPLFGTCYSGFWAARLRVEGREQQLARFPLDYDHLNFCLLLRGVLYRGLYRDSIGEYYRAH